MVCEGCGDCSVQSNCLSVEPLETEFGRKRAINQSSCNKDYSCVKGFCPSFVTVEGGRLKKGEVGRAKRPTDEFPPICQNRRCPRSTAPYGILVTGIGGTGVVTIGQILGMAAHLEGKGVIGARHVRPGAEGRRGDVARADRRNGRTTSTPRASTPAARDLVIGCDLIVTASTRRRRARWRRRARARWSTRSVTPTAAFVKNPNWQLPGSDLQARHPRGLRHEQRRFRRRRPSSRPR